MPLRARTAAIAACLLLALTACSDDAPVADPPATPTPTATSASASPSADDLTSAPPGETAEQFIRRWVELGNQLQHTGNAAAYLSVSGPDCDTCRELATTLSKIYRAGGESRGGTERITSLKPESQNRWILEVIAGPTEYERRAGAATEKLPGGSFRTRVQLAKDNGRWIVAFAEALS